MYGFIRGFQRWVWWPKCAPASSNCCMVTTLVAIGISPCGYASTDPSNRCCHRHRYGEPVCGMAPPLAEECPDIKRFALFGTLRERNCLTEMEHLENIAPIKRKKRMARCS